MKLQWAGNGADTPLVGQIQAQDLGAQFRGDSHYAPTCCGEESLGAPALDRVIGTSGSAKVVRIRWRGYWCGSQRSAMLMFGMAV
ncbi:MAG: hypothetical protein ACJA2P_001461 [Rhodoferax sp.]